MSYEKYKGKEKYHFRYYRRTQYHPFLVVLVTKESGNGKRIMVSGFNMTSSTLLFNQKPKRFIKLDINPNPQANEDSYVDINYVQNKPAKFFTRPIRGWRLSKQDEKKIDDLLQKKKGSVIFYGV